MLLFLMQVQVVVLLTLQIPQLLQQTLLQYLDFIQKGLTTAQLEDTMPVYLHSQAPGFYPANSSITVPNTGGTYTVEYILNRADIIK